MAKIPKRILMGTLGLVLSLVFLTVTLFFAKSNQNFSLFKKAAEIYAPTWSCAPSSDSRDGSGTAVITSPSPAQTPVGQNVNLTLNFTVGSGGIAPGGAVLIFVPRGTEAKSDDLAITKPLINNPSSVLNNFHCQENKTCIRTGDGLLNPGQLKSDLLRFGIPDTGLAAGRVLRISLQFVTTRIAQYEMIEGYDQSYKFLVAVDGDGDGIASFLPTASLPSLKILPDSGDYLDLSLPSLLKTNQPFKLVLKVKDVLGNLTPNFTGTVSLQNKGEMTVENLPGSYTFTGSEQGYKVFDNLLAKGQGKLLITGTASGLTSGDSNQAKVIAGAENNIYWGEIHVHSFQSDGTLSLYKLYDTAKRNVSLDFAAAADHSNWLTEGEWNIETSVTAKLNQPGEFVTIPGYEASFGTFTGGDINIYFPGDNGPVFYPKLRLYYTADGANPCEKRGPGQSTVLTGLRNAQELLSGSNLQALLQANAMAIPHHVSWAAGGSTWQWPVTGAAKFNYFNPELEKVVEIYSEQGNGEYTNNPLRHGQEFGLYPDLRDVRYAEPPLSEQEDPGFSQRYDCQLPDIGCLLPQEKKQSVQDALSRGFKLGFIAGSDDHWDTFPGGTRPPNINFYYNPQPPETRANCDSTLCYKGGYTAIYAPSLTRSDLFNAMRSRHTYATTGEKIFVKFTATVNGQESLMGDEISAAASPEFKAEVLGTKNLQKVEIVKGKVGNYDANSPFPSQTFSVSGNSASISWIDPQFDSSAFYYLRVTQDSAGFNLAQRPEMAWSSPIWVNKEALPSATPTPTPDFRIEIGKEEKVITAENNYSQSLLIDTAFPFIKLADGRFRIFLSTGNTRAYTLNSFSDITDPTKWKDEGNVLSPGNGFDNCGAWLNSIYKDPNNPGHWLGWYHAEYKSGACNGQAVKKSMAFAESFDEGLTWTKGDASHPYPNNQVITNTTNLLGSDETDDAGDAHVLKIGGYFYLFFLQSPTWGIHLARSPVASQGRPGTWSKYSQGKWDQPGIGGASDKIDGAGSSVSYSSYLNRYITLSGVGGRWGFWLSLPADNNITDSWTAYKFYPEISDYNDPASDDWISSNRQGTRGVYAYSWAAAENGDTEDIGQEFYLYYMKIFPKEGFDRRNLLRRKIKLFKNNPDPTFSKVVLTEYQKGTKTQVSTELSNPREGYQEKAQLGYLSAIARGGFKPLFDCYISEWDDHLLSVGENNTEYRACPESPNIQLVRKIGFLAPAPTDGADVPLYRCYDEQNLNHFASTNLNCNGKQNEFILGYIFYGETTPTNTPTPLPASCTEIALYDQNGQRISATRLNTLRAGDQIRFEVNIGNLAQAEGAAIKITVDSVVRNTLYLTQKTATGFTSDLYPLTVSGQYQIEAFVYSQEAWR